MMNDIQRRILAEAAKHGGANISVPEQMARAINEETAKRSEWHSGVSSFLYEITANRKKVKAWVVGSDTVRIAESYSMVWDPRGMRLGLAYRLSYSLKDTTSGATIKVEQQENTPRKGLGTLTYTVKGLDPDAVAYLKAWGLGASPQSFVNATAMESVQVTEAFIRQQQWATMRSNYKQGTPVNIVLKNGKTVSGTLLRMDKYDRGTTDQGHMLHVKTTGGNTKVEDVDVKSIYWNNDPKTKMSEETEIEEGVRMMAGAEKMVKDDPIGGSSMVSSLRAAKKSLEGKPTGSVLVVTKEKSPESMSIKVYAPSDFASLTKGLTKKPEAKVGSKGSWSGGEITVVAIKEEVEAAAFVNKSWGESVEVDESVSMPRDQRIARVKQNQDKIDRIKAYIAAKGLPLELQDTVGKRLPWLATDNQRLGTEEWLKRGPSAWVNQEGLYVGREIDRIINLLKHHGITIPHLESADQGGGMVSEYYRRGGFRSSSYSGDPRWITAKYAGVDAHGKPFKKGEEVLYFPNGKKFYTGAEAEKAWREFLSAKGDEMGMPYAS